MNLVDLHEKKGVSAQPISKLVDSKVIAIQILSDELLKEHLTKTPALLLCVKGEVEYQDEQGRSVRLKSADFMDIEPNVKHWVKGIQDSQLLLVK